MFDALNRSRLVSTLGAPSPHEMGVAQWQRTELGPHPTRKLRFPHWSTTLSLDPRKVSVVKVLCWTLFHWNAMASVGISNALDVKALNERNNLINNQCYAYVSDKSTSSDPGTLTVAASQMSLAQNRGTWSNEVTKKAKSKIPLRRISLGKGR